MTQPEPRPERPPMRIGNAEREEAAHALAEHFSHGRLEGEEYEERVGLAWTCRTTDDLAALFHDLPGPHPSVLVPPAPPPPPGHPLSGPVAAYGPPAGLTHHPQTYGASGLPHPGAFHPGDPAPFGREPGTGVPYSDKSKVTAGILQLFLGAAGVGRFYTGHTGIAIAQLIVTLVTFGLGAVWGVVDGIVLLAGRSTDSRGRPLRP